MDRKRTAAAAAVVAAVVGDCICIAVHQEPSGCSHNAVALVPAAVGQMVLVFD